MSESVYKEKSFFQKARAVVISRLIRITISFIIITVGFFITDTPIFATAATVIVWFLSSMFLSISSCLLTTGTK